MSHAAADGAQVTVRINGGPECVILPGEFIGRSRFAALHVDDPAISEAHALVSQRGSTLRLLALRGRFRVHEREVVETELVPGQRVALAPGITMDVSDVELPETVLAIENDAMGMMVVPPVASFTRGTDGPRPGWKPDADAILWHCNDFLRLRMAGREDRSLRPDDTFAIEGATWRVSRTPLADANLTPTAVAKGDTTPLVLVVRFDTVHVWAGERVTPIDGMPGRIVSELALIGAPIEWFQVARTIWPSETDEERLRVVWDGALGRLRRRLRATGIRTDLVRMDGGGRVELLLGPNDRIRDES
jgi:hypothetical protein